MNGYLNPWGCLRRLGFVMSALSREQIWSVCVSIIVCISCCCSVKAENQEYIVAAAVNRANLDVNKLHCISLSQRRSLIFGKSYSSDSRVEALTRFIFLGKEPNSDPNCPFVLLFNIVVFETSSVKYFGQKSTVLMSFDICELDSAGRVQTKICFSKNLYLFKRDIGPLEAFEVGLKSFMTPQIDEWTVMKIKRDRRMQ